MPETNTNKTGIPYKTNGNKEEVIDVVYSKQTINTTNTSSSNNTENLLVSLFLIYLIVYVAIKIKR
jgi:hypothetical protein